MIPPPVMFDANGNTLTEANGNTYTWDFENRMVLAVVPGTGTVTFKYDPFGRRIYKSSPTFSGIFAYDGYNLIETMNSSGTVVSRYTQTQNIDEPLAEDRSGGNSYYEADGLGSITSLSSSTGSVVNTYTYDSYGNVTNSTGTLSNPFRYTGREFDSETGAYFDRARYYESADGRFVSEDPIRFFGGMNFYAYVGNSPVDFHDPLGLCPSANNLTKAQCQAMQTVLNREQRYGTTIAAWMSAIGFGDNTIGPFNSSNTPPTNTPVGPIKVDWYTVIQLSGPSLTGGGNVLVYTAGKLIWTVERLLTGAPITNYLPFTDSAERNSFVQTLSPFSHYSDIFTPAFMKANCPQ